MIFDVNPVAKPRMTQRDKWQSRPAVARYRAYADELRLKANLSGYTLGGVVDVIFYLPIPKSWTKRKRAAMTGRPHQQRPDADNLGKAFKDALSVEDGHVYDERWRKFWTDGPGYIEVIEKA